MIPQLANKPGLTEYEQRRKNRLEKFLTYLDPESGLELKDDELSYFEHMHLFNKWRNKWYTEEEAIKMLMDPNNMGGKKYSYSMAYQLKKDADHLLATLHELRDDAVKIRLINQIEKSTQMALADKEASGIEKAEIIAKNAERIYKILGRSKESDLTPEDVMPHMNIVFNFQGNNQLNVTESQQTNNDTE